MIKDELINLLSEVLTVDKQYIFEEANLSLLCILSNYLCSLDDNKKKKIKIKKEQLKKNTLEGHQKDKHVFADISFLFESIENKNVIYEEKVGRDPFYIYQLLEVLLILEIESKFDIQILDEDWGNILTVGQALNSVEESIK